MRISAILILYSAFICVGIASLVAMVTQFLICGVVNEWTMFFIVAFWSSEILNVICRKKIRKVQTN